MNREYFIIKSTPYPLDIFVSYQADFEAFKKQLKKRLPKDLHNEIEKFEGKYDAQTAIFSNGCVCIKFNNINEGTIAHEAFHAVDFIMDKIGSTLTDASSEQYAYLLQYIVTEINKNYDRQRNKKDTRSDKKKQHRLR